MKKIKNIRDIKMFKNIKKGKPTIVIVIGLVCLIFTAVIFIQFKTINQTDITSLENMREDELRAEITTYKQRNEEVQEKIKETKETILEYEEAISSNEKATELLNQELEKSNNIIGKNEVKGPGIIVTLSDTKEQKISPDDLLLLVNELKAAGAEAISINNQRIVYNSYIVDLADTFISVNGERQVSPYTVKAIGNATYLESGLSKKQYGYIDTKIAEGKDVTLVRQDNIVINAYKGDLNFEYVKEVKE